MKTRGTDLMNTASRNFIVVILAVSALTITGCAVYPAHQNYAYEQYNYGPPPYASSYSYREKYHAHNMVYDRHLGVYVLLGLPDHYYYNNVYYRFSKNNWYYRHNDKDKWRKYDKRKLPEGLARKYRNDDRRNHRGWRS